MAAGPPSAHQSVTGLKSGKANAGAPTKSVPNAAATKRPPTWLTVSASAVARQHL